MSLLLLATTSCVTGRPVRRGHPAGEHVAEVPGRDAEPAATELRHRPHVVGHLRHHARPVDRVHGRQAAARRGSVSSANKALARSWQSSNVPSTATLCTFGASTVVICRRCTSDTRPAGWSTTMSSRSRPTHASMAAEPVSPDVATTIVARSPRRRQLVVEQPADELQRHVLERQGRPVEQLEQPQPVADVDDRAHVGMVEARVGVGHRRVERSQVDRPVDVGRHHRGGGGGVPVGRVRDRVGQRRPVLGDVQAAVAGEAGEQHVGELEHRGVAPGADVLH